MIADFHNDFLTSKNAKEVFKEYSTLDIIVVAAIFRGQLSYERAAEIASSFDFSNNIYLAYEDLGYKNLSEIERLLAYQPIYATLTWNGENFLGYGAHTRGKLKQSGKEAIKLCNLKNVAVDTAHISREGFYDIIDLADTVVNSHACFFDIRKHPRNVTIEELKLLEEKNALVGLCLYNDFLVGGGQADIESVYKHIDYFVQKFGCDRLVLGTDYYGCNDFPAKLESYAKLSALSDFLIKRGYSKENADKIMYKNLKSFLLKRRLAKF